MGLPSTWGAAKRANDPNSRGGYRIINREDLEESRSQIIENYDHSGRYRNIQNRVAISGGNGRYDIRDLGYADSGVEIEERYERYPIEGQFQRIELLIENDKNKDSEEPPEAINLALSNIPWEEEQPFEHE